MFLIFNAFKTSDYVENFRELKSRGVIVPISWNKLRSCNMASRDYITKKYPITYFDFNVEMVLLDKSQNISNT